MIELNVVWVLVIMFAGILVLIMLGTRIAFVLMIVAILSLIFFPSRLVLRPLAQAPWEWTNSFTLTCIPLFILMGELLVRGGVSEALYSTVEKWLRFLPGGLAHVNIGSCAIFAALSGSSLATAAAIGAISAPAMEARGYSTKLTFGSLAGGATLGILIPPSINMILYGALTDVSIGHLFIAGVIPGIILALSFMLYIGIWSWRMPSIAPRLPERVSWRSKFASLPRIIPAVILVMLVMGSIYMGVTTPTEAAAVGASGALLITIAQRNFSWRMLNHVLKETAYVAGMLFLVLIGAGILNYTLHFLQIPTTLTDMLVASGWNRYMVLAAFVLMYYVMGCFTEGISILVITTPVIFPIMMGLGFDPLWLGIVMVINCEVALITPPVGMNLYVLKGVSPKTKIEDIILGALPYVGVLTLLLVILTVWPQLATWLPSTMR